MRSLNFSSLLHLEYERLRNSSLVRNASWLMVGQTLSVLFRSVYFIILARLLGKYEYGIYAGAMALATILSQYSSLGSNWVFLQYVSQNKKLFSIYWGNIILTTVSIGSLFTVLLAVLGVHASAYYTHTLLLCVAAGECICMQMTVALSSIFQTFEKMNLSAFISLSVELFRLVLAISLLSIARHISATQWSYAALSVSAFAMLLAVMAVTLKLGVPTFSSMMLRRRGREGFVYALSNSAGNVYNDIDKVMLPYFGLVGANGIYSMAYKVINTLTTPISSVNSAAFPRVFLRAKGGVFEVSRYTIKILRRTIFLGIGMVLLGFLASPVIPWLVGSSYNECILALRWLSPIPLLRCLHWSAGDTLTGAGHQNLRMRAQMATAFFNVGINFYMIPHYGWRGAAWSSLLSDGLLVVMNWGMLMFLLQQHRRNRDNTPQQAIA